MKFYSDDDCRRKQEQHMEMASLALIDGDKPDWKRNMDLAAQWGQRRKEGGYLDD